MVAQPQVIGLEELEEDLTVNAIEIIRNAAATQMEIEAEQLVNQLEMVAPVYNGPETHRSDGTPIIKGALKASLDWHWVGARDRQFQTRGSGQFKRKSLKLVVTAGSDAAFYVRWVEFGTATWAGNPFFFVTYRNNRRGMQSRITRAITGSIKRINDL